ncbi:beta-mannosidase [Paenibacillus senegalensis]|uniref:beta-mannosidase n=1 Tax=Paenibacillus senegalensis TaxID=1465766 RepID=UPI000287FC00|nr:glycoside hydrolase family 2 protein [Paenibacillus senegalensis]
MKPKQLVLNDWKFKACDELDWMPARVPGCVHTDLFRNGKIPDPFYGTNEHDLQWIDKKNWEYETVFTLPRDMMALDELELVFDGLDTYADIYVNGKMTLSADNMFRTWRINLKKERIRSGENHIRILFRSPIQEDLPKLEKLGHSLPAANDQSALGGLGDRKVSVFARKAPYHYGWDWGPRFVTSGIWRECRIEGWSGARIKDLFIRQDKVTPAFAQLTAVFHIEADQSLAATLSLSTAGQHWEIEAAIAPGNQIVELALHIDRPKLWWSRGLGEPNLYEFHAELTAGSSPLAKASVRTGLRSVRLVRNPDEAGTSFFLELNGVPVFAKGANHIPNDSFLPEVTEERYRHEIASAAEANMNMLRVWGGGIYEADVFYDLCDEHGIMVWQDFMFSCSMYPGDDEFLENVRLEAQENVVRLRNHPSVVLWCGNNEIDLAWAHYNENAGWGWKKAFNAELREKIWADYEAIFHSLLPDAVSSLAPGAEYWPSSPLVSLSRDEHQHANPRRTSGDIHYWGVWHNKEPFEQYNVYVGRFMSEYGFQSFPEPKTVGTFADKSDWSLESKVMTAHQKHGNGNALILHYMEQYTKTPKDFESFLYVSQFQQAEAIQTAIEAHRRRKPYCMGSLYWQMNDCWPVASWSGIDYFGRWKALHYIVKRSFRDVSLAIAQQNDTLAVHLISDVQAPVEGTLCIRLYSFEGEVLCTASLPVNSDIQAADILYQTTVSDLLGHHDPAAVVFRAELKQNGKVIDSKDHLFVKDKELQLQAPALTITAIPGSGGSAFTVDSSVFARQVWLSSETEGIFSDNCFNLVPGIPQTVTFLSRPSGKSVFRPASPGSITAISLADCVQLQM